MLSLSPAELVALRAAIQGKEASSFESIRRDVPVAASAMAGLNMAMLDVVGKFGRAPVYQVLGGPTRNKARALARIDGETDDAIVASIGQARAAGHRAFLVPVPMTHSRNHSATLVNATRQRLDRVPGQLPWTTTVAPNIGTPLSRMTEDSCTAFRYSDE